MRKLVAALLAVPVILATYLPRSIRARGTAGFVVALLPLLAAGSILTMSAGEPGPSTPAAAVAGIAGGPGTDGSTGGSIPLDAGAPGGAASLAGLPVSAPLERIAGGPLRFASLPPVPEIVRFRPRPGTTGVPAAAQVSVRFTEAMDPSSGLAAFRIVVNGTSRAIAAHRWAEGDTVLVVTPKGSFPAGASVTISVTSTARSARGVALARAGSASFTVAKPAPAPSVRITPIVRGVGLTGVEHYILGLMNCTRTGGWVLSNGTCRGAGTRAVAPLRLDAGISDRVARPYAWLLASRRLCHHYYDGGPADRLRRAGYTSYQWAENLGGCGSNDPYWSALSTHLYFQSEGYYGAHGHYRNMMNALYDRAGIGAVKVNGVFRFVVDFYHP